MLTPIVAVLSKYQRSTDVILFFFCILVPLVSYHPYLVKCTPYLGEKRECASSTTCYFFRFSQPLQAIVRECLKGVDCRAKFGKVFICLKVPKCWLPANLCAVPFILREIKCRICNDDADAIHLCDHLGHWFLLSLIKVVVWLSVLTWPHYTNNGNNER